MTGVLMLTQSTFDTAVSQLVAVDPDLGRVVNRWGAPPFWTHPTGFPGLVLAILAQQVSVESANAAFDKLALPWDCGTGVFPGIGG